MSPKGARAGLGDRLRRELALDLPMPEPGAPGDPGLFGPDSMVWRIARERVLLAAGPCALLLQIAHPLVAAGVAAHSGFRRDPFKRLAATLAATLSMSFGDRAQCEAALATVRATHRTIRGELSSRRGIFSAGTPYRASDPELALWVHATLVLTALEGSDALVGRLSDDERARYYEEAKPFGALFGATDSVMPATVEGFMPYVRRMIDGPVLHIGPEASELSRSILAPPVSGPLRPASAMARLLTAGFLPPHLRDAYGLQWGARERAAFRGICAGTRAALPVLPSRVRYWPHYRVALNRMQPRGDGDAGGNKAA